MSFQEAVEVVLGEAKTAGDEAVSRGRCPDQYVGTVGQSFSDWKRQDIGYQDFPANLDSVVILVLESPHRSEFEQPVGPAKGPTGRNIAAWMEAALAKAEVANPNSYHLILVNAVQYQCSLGEKPLNTVIRDRIFSRYWEQNGAAGRRDFVQRMESYWGKWPDAIVINACTKELMDLVRESDVEFSYEVSHPASWIGRAPKLNPPNFSLDT